MRKSNYLFHRRARVDIGTRTLWTRIHYSMNKQSAALKAITPGRLRCLFTKFNNIKQYPTFVTEIFKTTPRYQTRSIQSKYFRIANICKSVNFVAIAEIIIVKF